MHSELSDRERRVLAAVIQSYVATAEPAGSRMIARKFGLNVSPATIRNTMSDLEEKGFLFHPHTSAGRVPTHKAYRVYVDALIHVPALEAADQDRLSEHLATAPAAGQVDTIDAILRRAAQSLGVLTQELGVAVGPQLDAAALRQIDLVRLASDRLLVVFTLDRGAVRTVFVEVPGEIADDAVREVARVLNERLAGRTMAELRGTLAERLRDAPPTADAADLLNIFVAGAGPLIEPDAGPGAPALVMGQPSLLADQPEFASGPEMRRLLELTETREDLARLLTRRAGHTAGLSITIGSEHDDPRLAPFTVVTAEYRAAGLSGVIGVIGPTRMPYEKVIALVSHTSRLVSDLLH
ncbi:heat-inducible transcription repressor HrcA [Gemmatimonadetes bacterium T265]|nr:heat-inducible transcription repressor HrcA [Gemmatimonadetes bacterium T265]